MTDHINYQYYFDYVEQKALVQFDKVLEHSSEIEIDPTKVASLKDMNQSEKARIGFYYLVLSRLTQKSDLKVIDEMILDTSYQSTVHDVNNNDLGIDAVHIDSKNSLIYLFNFKYHETYTCGKHMTLSDSFSSLRFLIQISNELQSNVNVASDGNGQMEITRHVIKDIVSLFKNPNKKWTLKMVFVSNYDAPFSDKERQSIVSSAPSDVKPEVECCSLPDILNFLQQPSIETIARAKLRISKNSMMEVTGMGNEPGLDSNDEKRTLENRSIICQLSMADVLKLFSDQNSIREKPYIDQSDYEEKFKGLQLNQGFIQENIRGFLKTGYNRDIISSAIFDTDKFFYFNNGLTIVCTSVESKPANLHNDVTISNYQLVNGGQTVNSLFEANNQHFSVENLDKLKVLARVYCIVDPGVRSSISQYTNSQNPISSVDLRSTDPLQLIIELELGKHGINYVRKREGASRQRKMPDKSIYMETFGQIIFSAQGHPEGASNKKQYLFDTYYHTIFNRLLTNNIDEYLELCDDYFENENLADCNQQENFYLIYMKHNAGVDFSYSQEECLNIIHQLEVDDIDGKVLQPKRKLILKTFKGKIDERIHKNRIPFNYRGFHGYLQRKGGISEKVIQSYIDTLYQEDKDLCVGDIISVYDTNNQSISLKTCSISDLAAIPIISIDDHESISRILRFLNNSSIQVVAKGTRLNNADENQSLLCDVLEKYNSYLKELGL